MLVPVTLVASVALLAAAGCGGSSSKPAYCSDFPSETSAIKSSVDSLSSAVKALPSSPSTSQIAAIGVDVAAVTSSVKSFNDATSSKC